MDQATWLACADPRPMLEFLRAGGKASSRKFRLFAGACCRRVWHLLTEHARTAVEVVEAVADGREPLRKLDVSREGVWKEIYPGVGAAARDNARRVADTAAWCATQAGVHGPAVFSCADYVSIAVGYERSYPNLEPAKQGEKRAQSDLVRDLFGNPFRLAPVHPGWLAWDAGTVARLGRAIYDDRQLPQGTLDPALLAVLADALEEAGCTDADILDHLRGPGPHVRGCHVLDALLAKG